MSEEEIVASPPSGKWSVAEVISHLAAWQELSVARLEAALLDSEPRLPAWLDGADPFYADDHANEFNARIQELRAGLLWRDRYEDWKGRFLRSLDLAEATAESIMFEAKRFPWMRGQALSSVIEGYHEHHQEHLDNILARYGREG